MCFCGKSKKSQQNTRPRKQSNLSQGYQQDEKLILSQEYNLQQKPIIVNFYERCIFIQPKDSGHLFDKESTVSEFSVKYSHNLVYAPIINKTKKKDPQLINLQQDYHQRHRQNSQQFQITGLKLQYFGNQEYLLHSDDSKQVHKALEFLEKKIYKTDFEKIYRLKEQIKSGNYYQLYKAINIFTQEYFTVKIWYKDYISQEEYKTNNVYQEIDILKYLNSKEGQNALFDQDKNLVSGKNAVCKFVEAFEDEHKILLVYQYYQGDLLQHLLNLYEGNEHFLPIASIKPIMKQIIQGLYYIHCKKIIHRNLKPQYMQFKYKLSDLSKKNPLILLEFDQATQASQTDRMVESLGISKYASPEEIIYKKGQKQYNLSQTIDIYNAGIIFYQLLFNHYPYKTKLQYHNFEQMVQDKEQFAAFLKNQRNLTPHCLDLIMKMLETNHDNRVNAKQVLNHPFWREAIPVETPKQQNPQKKPMSQKSQLTDSENEILDGLQTRTENATKNNSTRRYQNTNNVRAKVSSFSNNVSQQRINFSTGVCDLSSLKDLKQSEYIDDANTKINSEYSKGKTNNNNNNSDSSKQNPCINELNNTNPSDFQFSKILENNTVSLGVSKFQNPQSEEPPKAGLNVQNYQFKCHHNNKEEKI